MIYPNWPAPTNIHAFTTTRQGGVSLPPFASLNLGSRTGDKQDHVAQNRLHVRQTEKLPSEPYWLYQTHSTTVLDISHYQPQQTQQNCLHKINSSHKISSLHKINSPLKIDEQIKLEADASYTRQEGKVSVVLTADCLPVLFCSRFGDEVAAAHAGWRGLCHGILEATSERFTCPKTAILAWLGPAIGPQQFEVGEEVRQQFIAVDPEASKAFQPILPTSQCESKIAEKKYLADLYLLARQRLAAVGITDVYGGDHCTYREADKFYSYRRENVTGRMASMIWFE
ncbi:peptidoglycan editing factor PgeF [Orbaceae bacterium ESL0727]|nr:peptidoglycan editing factor PgeF [Orbaceae bacterium ESL0727]